MKANSESDETNVNHGKKLMQWSDEALNAGKEIEAMKRLTLHRIASSLHRFIAPVLLPIFALGRTTKVWVGVPIWFGVC
jgi:hypothetical protein